MMEDVEKEGVKMKTTYVVSAPKDGDITIKASEAINMTKEDIKAMVVAQLQEAMPEQVEAMLPQLEQAIEGGMIKIEGSGHSTYVFRNDGWLKSSEVTSTINAMGTNTESVEKTTLKESNK